MMVRLYAGFRPNGKLIVSSQTTNPMNSWHKLRREFRMAHLSIARCKNLGFVVRQTGMVWHKVKEM